MNWANLTTSGKAPNVPTNPSDRVINGVRQYCGSGCYSAAAKAGRLVRATQWGNLCSLCESRAREGLLHYRPSNGTEFQIFEGRCETCRHYNVEAQHDMSIQPRNDVPGNLCTWAVLDRITNQMWSEHDAACNWFHPADLATHDANGRYICPAECKRYTHKDDRDGEWRDPPPRDVPGQLLLEELLDVPEPTRESVTV